MKRLFSTVLALALVLSVGSAFAKDGISVGLGMGLNPDAASTAETVYTSAMGMYPSPITEDLLKTASGMTGLDFGLDLQANWKFLFFRTGFDFEIGFGGGIDQFVSGATSKTTLENSYMNMNIPVILGLNYAINEKSNMYIGAGIRYNMGTLTLKQITDTKQDFSALGLGVLDGVNTVETKAKLNGIGFTFIMGGDYEIMDNLSLFAEYQYDAAAKPVVADVTNKTTGLDTAYANPIAKAVLEAGNLFQDKASKTTQIVDNGGNTFRFGVKYCVFGF